MKKYRGTWRQTWLVERMHCCGVTSARTEIKLYSAATTPTFRRLKPLFGLVKLFAKLRGEIKDEQKRKKNKKHSS